MSDQFIDKEIIALENGISHLINLTELSLDLILDVRASNDSINSIAKGIKSLKNLEKLYANLNIRSGQVLDILTYIDSFNYLQNAELRIFGKNSYFKKINQKINLDDQKTQQKTKLKKNVNQKAKMNQIVQVQNLWNLLFTSKQFQRISNSLTYLQQLQFLTLIYNQKNGFGPQSAKFLGNALKSLHELLHLNLKIGNFNQINQDGAYNLSQGIKSLSGLRSLQLYLEGCNIQRQGAILIGDSLSYLTRLKTLWLLIVQDKIQSDGAVAIGRAIKNLYDLNELKIQIGEQNEIKKIGAYEIGVGMQFLTNLTHLRLIIKDNNDIESDGISSICKSISKMIYLKQGAIQIGDRLSYLISLRTLSLVILEDQIEDKGAIQIGRSFKFLSNLTNLNIKIGCNNTIQLKGACGIGEGIENLINLTKLSLAIDDFNNIESGGISKICKGISNMKDLQYLNLQFGNNQIISASIKEISLAIKHLEQLKKFQISIHISEITSNYALEIVDLIRLLDTTALNFNYEIKDYSIIHERQPKSIYN
ncbi:hypothetical protein ABPG72_020522 [Tetrahymena utriculariae]